MPKLFLLSLLGIVTPIAARADPARAEPAGADGDPHTRAAVQFADALSSQPVDPTERLGLRIVFEPGRARVYSRDREKLMGLAASWRRNNGWATVNVVGYASGSHGVALAQLRARIISDYLIRYGVAAEYVVAIGHEPVGGGMRSERGAGDHVELTLERCPRSAAECRRKPLRWDDSAKSTVK